MSAWNPSRVFVLLYLLGASVALAPRAAVAGCTCGCGMTTCTMPNCPAGGSSYVAPQQRLLNSVAAAPAPAPYQQVTPRQTQYYQQYYQNNTVAGGSTPTNRYVIPGQTPAYNTPPPLTPNQIPRTLQPFNQNQDFTNQRNQSIMSTYPGGVDYRYNPYNANGNVRYGYPGGTNRYNTNGDVITPNPRPQNAPPNTFIYGKPYSP